MVSISAVAVGVVSLVTSQLGRDRRQRSTPMQPSDGPSAASTAVIPASTVVEKPADGPVILTSRAQWGAVEPSLDPNGSGEQAPYDPVINPNGWLVYDQPLADVLDTIILHHSALPLSDGPREIQRLHMEEKGFADIGYHYLLDQNGNLFEGRAMNVRGAHTFNYNYGSVGICLIGNFEEIQPSEAQLNLLTRLVKALLSLYPRIDHLAGHKDFNPGVTLCPGKNFYALLPSLAQDHSLRYGI